MIYSDKTASEYSEMASRLPAGREGFQRLTDMGLVEVIATAEPVAATPTAKGPLVAPQAEVVEIQATHSVDEAALQRSLYPEFVRTVGDLGFRGMFLQLKVEKAMSATELLGLREQVEKAVEKSRGDSARQDFSKRIDFLLSQ
jgi:hypothetical protein